MTAPTRPVPVDELIPRAHQLAVSLGEIPGRNRLMRELRVGSEKADELRKRLVLSGVDFAFARRLLRPGPPAELPPVQETEVGLDEPPAGPVAAERQQAATPDPPAPAEPVPAASEPARPAASAAVEAVAEPTPVPARRPDLPTSAGAPAAGTLTPRPVRLWPLWLLAAPAMVAIWSGWVGLGSLTGFGTVYPLPGIADDFSFNSAITLPIGVETYAAFALRVWLSGTVPPAARRFARRSAIGSLVLGAAGQVAYHLMVAAGVTAAPWQITTAVSCLPVAVLGMGAALAHLIRANGELAATGAAGRE
jgi:hypothetical protein